MGKDIGLMARDGSGSMEGGQGEEAGQELEEEELDEEAGRKAR